MYLARANTVIKCLRSRMRSKNEWGKESGARWGKRMGNSAGPGHNVADAAAQGGTARLQGPGTQS